MMTILIRLELIKSHSVMQKMEHIYYQISAYDDDVIFSYEY